MENSKANLKVYLCVLERCSCYRKIDQWTHVQQLPTSHVCLVNVWSPDELIIGQEYSTAGIPPCGVCHSLMSRIVDN